MGMYGRFGLIDLEIDCVFPRVLFHFSHEHKYVVQLLFRAAGNCHRYCFVTIVDEDFTGIFLVIHNYHLIKAIKTIKSF